jgi:rhodanese-related sulfurtransferase
MASTEAEGSSGVRNRRRKNNGSFKPTKQEQLERQVQFYQERTWPQIPRMTPQELVSLQEQGEKRNGENEGNKHGNNNNKVLLIDVRTAAERAVSVIPGSVPLQEVTKRGSATTVQLIDPDTTVVVYCTIGYRSGMEATRLLHRYPTLQGRLYNLDGIVAYTYLHSSDNNDSNNDNATDVDGTANKEYTATQDECSPLSPASLPATTSDTQQQQQQQQQNHQRHHNLVDPITNCEVFTVHTFGSMWSLAESDYTASHFSLPQLAVRLGQVGGWVVVRFVQRVAHYTVQMTRSCCGIRSNNNAFAQ